MNSASPEQEKNNGTMIQLVVVRLADEHYAIPIKQVQEIIQPADITPVPKMPAYLRGVMNLRGKIVPIVDLHRHLRLGTQTTTEHTRIVVSSTTGQPVGVIVDAVSQVIRLAPDMIAPVPASSSSLNSAFVRGVGRAGDQLVIVLNLDLIIADLEGTASGV